jgi:predicted DNA-binding protein
MTITIDLSPEQERRLAALAARAGQDVTGYVHYLIDRDIDVESLDAILAPVRREFDQSGMTDDDVAALVEEVREDIWREKHGRPSKAP